VNAEAERAAELMIARKRATTGLASLRRFDECSVMVAQMIAGVPCATLAWPCASLPSMLMAAVGMAPKPSLHPSHSD
jgi:hypothetical protein